MTARCKLSPVLRTASPEAPGPLSLPSGDRGPRLRRASVVRWTLAGLTFSAALAWLSRHFPSLLFEDDAYFYLQIGWNLGTGAGSTFDGLHQTDGYHLLWAWMLAPLAWGTASLGLGKTTFVAAVSALALAVSGAAVLATFRAPVERALAMLLFLFGGLAMETTLLAALGLLLLRAHLGEGGATPARVALVAALVPLTRIDYAWLAPSLALLGLGNRRPAHALPLVPALAGTVAGMAIHFSVEHLIFGAWTSVSSAYRADRIAGDYAAHLLSNVSRHGHQIRYALAAWLAATAVYGFVSRQLRTRDLAAAGLVLLLPVAVYSVLTICRDWYFTSPLLLGLMMASRAAGPSRAWTAATAAATAVLAMAFVGYLALNVGDMRRTRAFVEAANGVLTPRDVVYQIDGAGFIGYWLNARVVNGDGLVNSWDYRRRLLANDLGSYLQDIGATHVVTNRQPEPLLVSWHGLVVREEDAMLVADAGATSNAFARLRLFALRPGN